MPSPTPEDIPSAFTRAWNAGDADAVGALFAEDAEFVNVVGLWWHNRERIRRAHAIAFESYFDRATVEVVRTKVRRLSDDHAIVHWRWRLAGQTAPDSGAGSERSGIFVMVAERRPEGWMIVTAQNTDVIPGAETILAKGVIRRGAKY